MRPQIAVTLAAILAVLPALPAAADGNPIYRYRIGGSSDGPNPGGENPGGPTDPENPTDPEGSPLSISSPSIPSTMRINTTRSAPLSAAGGTGTYTYSAGPSTPSFVSVTPAGVVSLNPAPNDVGSHPGVRFLVNDGKATAETAEYTILVTEATNYVVARFASGLYIDQGFAPNIYPVTVNGVAASGGSTFEDGAKLVFRGTTQSSYLFKEFIVMDGATDAPLPPERQPTQWAFTTQSSNIAYVLTAPDMEFYRNAPGAYAGGLLGYAIPFARDSVTATGEADGKTYTISFTYEAAEPDFKVALTVGGGNRKAIDLPGIPASDTRLKMSNGDVVAPQSADAVPAEDVQYVDVLLPPVRRLPGDPISASTPREGTLAIGGEVTANAGFEVSANGTTWANKINVPLTAQVSKLYGQTKTNKDTVGPNHPNNTVMDPFPYPQSHDVSFRIRQVGASGQGEEKTAKAVGPVTVRWISPLMRVLTVTGTQATSTGLASVDHPALYGQPILKSPLNIGQVDPRTVGSKANEKGSQTVTNNFTFTEYADPIVVPGDGDRALTAINSTGWGRVYARVQFNFQTQFAEGQCPGFPEPTAASSGFTELRSANPAVDPFYTPATVGLEESEQMLATFDNAAGGETAVMALRADQGVVSRLTGNSVDRRGPVTWDQPLNGLVWGLGIGSCGNAGNGASIEEAGAEYSDALTFKNPSVYMVQLVRKAQFPAE